MKIEKYALLDTDFISKTHFIHGDTEKCLVDLVVEMPGYCFFCHSQIIKELSRHNQQAIGWLQHKISEQKIQCYTDEEILNELVKIRGDFACSTYINSYVQFCGEHNQQTFRVMEASVVARMQRVPCKQALEEIFQDRFVELQNGFLKYRDA